MEFNEENNVIPAVYYLDKNELWYIKNIENIEKRDGFRIVKRNKLRDCGIQDFEILKIIAKKI